MTIDKLNYPIPPLFGLNVHYHGSVAEGRNDHFIVVDVRDDGRLTIVGWLTGLYIDKVRPTSVEVRGTERYPDQRMAGMKTSFDKIEQCIARSKHWRVLTSYREAVRKEQQAQQRPRIPVGVRLQSGGYQSEYR